MSKFDDCEWNNCLYLVTTTGDGAGSQLVWGLAAVYDLYLKLIVGGGETDAYEGEAEYTASALIDGDEWHGNGSDGLPLTKTWNFEDGTFGVTRVTDENIPEEVIRRTIKVVTDTSERNMVSRKVCIELDGPVGRDGATIKINGWVVAQYVDDGESEQTTIIRVAVSGPILGT